MIHAISRCTLIGAVGVAALISGCQQPQNSTEPKTAPGQLPSFSKLHDKNAPSSADAPKINATTYYAHAHLLEKQGNFPQAAEQYQQVLGIQPDFLAARNRLAVTLNKLGQHAQATQHFQTCLAAQPGAAFLHNNLGFSLFLEGKYDQADASFRRALELTPDFSRARMNLAVNHARRNQFDASFQEFAKVCNQADAFYNVGILLVEAGRYADAAQYLEGALAANPQFDAARKQLNEVARMTAQGDAVAAADTRTPMLSAIEQPTGNGAEVSLAGDPTESGAVTLAPTIPVTNAGAAAVAQTPAPVAPTPAPAPAPTPIETGAVTHPATIPVIQEPAKQEPAPSDAGAVIHLPTIPVIQEPAKAATPPTSTETTGKTGG